MSPICSLEVPQESIRNAWLRDSSLTACRKAPSAAGERQILPWHTKRTPNLFPCIKCTEKYDSVMEQASFLYSLSNP